MEKVDTKAINECVEEFVAEKGGKKVDWEADHIDRDAIREERILSQYDD